MHAAAKELNDLPKELRNCSGLKTFKSKIFKFCSDFDNTEHKCSL